MFGIILCEGGGEIAWCTETGGIMSRGGATLWGCGDDGDDGNEMNS